MYSLHLQNDRHKASSKKTLQCAGFTYVGVLLIVAMMGAGLAKTGELWSTLQKREKENQLLFAGGQYRLAILRYYQNTPSGVKQGPANLEDLLKDPRTPAIQRYLRKPYIDPFTGKSDWLPVKGADGRIIGVRSQSTEHPLKQDNFSWSDRFMAGKDKYSDWLFVAEMGGVSASQVQPGSVKISP